MGRTMNLELKDFDIDLKDEDLSLDKAGLADLDLDLDLDGFSDGDVSLVANRYVLPKIQRKVKSVAVKHDNAQAFVSEVGKSILAGETVHALLSGNFIFGEIFEALAVQNNVLIEDLTASTLSISQENIDSLHNLMEADYIGTLNLIVSDYYWSYNRQNAPYIYEKLDIDGRFQLAVSGTHTKITLLKINGKKIVCKGSANFRSSRSVEEVTFETNEELYDFHMAWHEEILREYGTIKKAIRASMLFDVIVRNTKGRKSWLRE